MIQSTLILSNKHQIKLLKMYFNRKKVCIVKKPLLIFRKTDKYLNP